MPETPKADRVPIEKRGIMAFCPMVFVDEILP